MFYEGGSNFTGEDAIYKRSFKVDDVDYNICL